MKPFLYLYFKYFQQIFYNSDARRLPALDGLRALAILYLIIFHTFQLRLYAFDAQDKKQLLLDMLWWQQWVVFGDKGVDVFFVLSGFLIASLLFREYTTTQRINPWRFIARRFLRLSPLYYCLVAVFFIQAAPWVEREFYFLNILYLNNTLELSRQYIPWVWSLAVEMQFYLLLMLYVPLFFKLPAKFLQLLFLVLLSFFWRAWLLQQDASLNIPIVDMYSRSAEQLDHYVQQLYISLFTRGGPLILGVMAAYSVLFYQDFLQRCHRGSVQLTAIMMMAMIQFFPYFQWTFSVDVNLVFLAGHRLFFSIAVMLIILSFWMKKSSEYQEGQGVVVAVLSWRGFSVIAQLSFAMFLGHIPVLLAVQSLCGSWLAQFSFFNGMGVLFLFSLPVIVLGSLTVYCLIERPVMSLRRFIS